ncbi:MAG: precorrin-8X methylmutase [Pseudomonadota bacterium]
MTLFDDIVIVDWSANATPKSGADSIWWAHVAVTPSKDAGSGAKGGLVGCENPTTRAKARAQLEELRAALRAQGRRVLIGFDFPFGYPAGSAKLLAGAADARALWARISDELEDKASNANTRFALADRWVAEGAPFWGHPHQHTGRYSALAPTKGRFDTVPEFRLAETYAKARGAHPKSLWQLTGTGSVGSQALTGLPLVVHLSSDPDTEVWPIDTGLQTPSAGTVLAEVYPSLVPFEPAPGEIKDQAQVRSTAARFAQLDRDGQLARLFEGPQDITAPQRTQIVKEEAWILGLGCEHLLAPRAPITYEKDPKAIYAQSFATVRAEARLDHLPLALHPVAIRLIHACGMTDLAGDLRASPDLLASAQAALSARAPIFCDCEMVRAGIIPRGLPDGVERLCTLNDPDTAPRAQRLGTTRSAAAVEAWRDRLEGSLVAIGNAPTALFHLLEMILAGGPRPAAILGFPVGFVGAAESKEALASLPHHVPFLTLQGRRGGSALASAAVNALTLGLEGDGR